MVETNSYAYQKKAKKWVDINTSMPSILPNPSSMSVIRYCLLSKDFAVSTRQVCTEQKQSTVYCWAWSYEEVCVFTLLAV